jgi:hypothetical protein
MTSDPLAPARTCELHVHTGGCLYAQDLAALGQACFRDVDWSLFCQAHLRAFGQACDPVSLFDQACGGRLEGLRQSFVVTAGDAGDFDRFQARFNLLICLVRHLRQRHGNSTNYMLPVVERHRRQGMRLVEYRCMLGSFDDDDEFVRFHVEHAELLRDASTPQSQFRYIISLPRWRAIECYRLVRRILEQRPDLAKVIVGLDFCFVEEGYPPRQLREFFAGLAEDNRRKPAEALHVVYHVGESYFDKSLESAIRWCDEAAALGARRLGHAIALGLDPAVAVARRDGAHESETVAERLHQIDWDLGLADRLNAFGVPVDPQRLAAERRSLQEREPTEQVHAGYTASRLEALRRRQAFVLERLAALGTVIETCPTSNLLIGGVPEPHHHPVHRFLASPVPLVIGADDPGIFETTLGEEVDWVLRHSGWTPQRLAQRLGDPLRFRLGRPTHAAVRAAAIPPGCGADERRASG